MFPNVTKRKPTFAAVSKTFTHAHTTQIKQSISTLSDFYLLIYQSFILFQGIYLSAQFCSLLQPNYFFLLWGKDSLDARAEWTILSCIQKAHLADPAYIPFMGERILEKMQLYHLPNYMRVFFFKEERKSARSNFLLISKLKDKM